MQCTRQPSRFICRYTPSDEQLYKDVDALLDGIQDVVSRLQPLRPLAFAAPETLPGGVGLVVAAPEHQNNASPRVVSSRQLILDPNNEIRSGSRAAPETLLGGVGLLVPLLELWDGVCGLYMGRPKPSHWVAILLRIAKLFPPDVRESSGKLAQVRTTAFPIRLSLFARQTRNRGEKCLRKKWLPPPD